MKTAQVKAALARRYRVKDLGELHYFLGVRIEQNLNKSGYTWIGQPAYIQNVLNKFGFEQCIEFGFELCIVWNYPS